MAEAAEKATKAAVDYRKSANAGSDRCGICVHFWKGPPPRCEIVSGDNSPRYVCDRFKARSKRQAIYGKEAA